MSVAVVQTNKIFGEVKKNDDKAQSQMEAELAAVSIADIHREIAPACTAKRQ